MLNTRLQGLYFLTIIKLINQTNNMPNDLNAAHFCSTNKGPINLGVYNLYAQYLFGTHQPLKPSKLLELSNSRTVYKGYSDYDYLNSIVKLIIEKTNNVSTQDLIQHIKNSTPWEYTSFVIGMAKFISADIAI
jgi:hypothetical protein